MIGSDAFLHAVNSLKCRTRIGRPSGRFSCHIILRIVIWVVHLCILCLFLVLSYQKAVRFVRIVPFVCRILYVYCCWVVVVGWVVVGLLGENLWCECIVWFWFYFVRWAPSRLVCFIYRGTFHDFWFVAQGLSQRPAHGLRSVLIKFYKIHGWVVKIKMTWLLVIIHDWVNTGLIWFSRASRHFIRIVFFSLEFLSNSS